MNEQVFNDLKLNCKEAGRADKAEGMQLVPFQSERFKVLIHGLSYKQQQVMVTEYAVGYRGYRLDIKNSLACSPTRPMLETAIVDRRPGYLGQSMLNNCQNTRKYRQYMVYDCDRF